jgi:hypothetical protein
MHLRPRPLNFVTVMKKLTLFLFFVLLSCVKLDVLPRGMETGEQFFADEASYKIFLARIYAGLAVTGQQGPSGDPDLENIDEGFSSYLRQYWQLQELTTDEAVISWADEGLDDLQFQSWTSDNQFIRTMYSRIFFQVALVNEFLRQTSPEKLAQRNVSPETRALVPRFRAEARFLRALSYTHGLDFFGRLPLYLETSPQEISVLPQSSRLEVFDFINSELYDIVEFLPAPGTQDYGRADRATIWALQARLFLNAEVYIDQLRYDECLRVCRKIIDAGVFNLEPEYKHLFGADNHTSPEIIFSIPFDGNQTQTWGGMTYLVHAALGGQMEPADYGVSGAWAGLRTTSACVNFFAEESFPDRRALFFTEGQTLQINDITNFQQGYAVPKYTNLRRDGTAGGDEIFPDTDYPLFRLAEIYLTFAEASLFSGTGDRGDAARFLNALQRRAGASPEHDLTADDITEATVRTTRARELYWEGHRRTDLIRYGQYTGATAWPWKGGVAAGTATSDHLRLFPLPTAELLANSLLQQNAGY